MSISYEKDVVAWASEQAALLRAGRFSELDIEHIADEVEDVGRSERRELLSRMAVLMAHLLKWQVQPELRSTKGKSWSDTIKVQREDLADHLDETPSLRPSLENPEWQRRAWRNAITLASSETGLGLDDLPASCPWTPEQLLDREYLPE
jgi:hypothetical protein